MDRWGDGSWKDGWAGVGWFQRSIPGNVGPDFEPSDLTKRQMKCLNVEISTNSVVQRLDMVTGTIQSRGMFPTKLWFRYKPTVFDWQVERIKGICCLKHLIAIPWPMTSELDVCPKMTLLTCEVVKLGQVLTYSQVRGNTGREHSISRSQRRLFCCGLQISKTQAMFGKALDMYDEPS